LKLRRIVKSKFCWLAVVLSAAVAAPVQADDHRGRANVAVPSRGSARVSASSVRSVPRGNFGGGRAIMQGQRFSSVGIRPPQTAFRHPSFNPNRSALINRQFTPRPLNRSEGLMRFANRETSSVRIENRDADRSGQFTPQPLNRSEGLMRFAKPETSSARVENRNDDSSGQFTSQRPNRTDGLTRFSNSETRAVRTENRNAGRFGQLGNRNRGLRTGREHVFARRSANWQPSWDRRHDHWWNGHRCRFINGVWVIFDLGFYPWWSYYGYPYDYGYPSGYPYDYYPSYYSSDYPYEYDPGSYDQNYGEYYGRGTYDPSDQYTDRTVIAVQTQLAKEGYYRGEIDGILGPETRRAIVSFQSDHGLRVTGNLTQETLSTLGLD